MAEIETLCVDLPPELASELRAAVARGEYDSVSQAVREALRDWQDRREHGLTLGELRLLAQQGADSGDGLEADQVFARLRARFSPKAS